jgi:hypothetical protein
MARDASLCSAVTIDQARPATQRPNHAGHHDRLTGSCGQGSRGSDLENKGKMARANRT